MRAPHYSVPHQGALLPMSAGSRWRRRWVGGLSEGTVALDDQVASCLWRRRWVRGSGLIGELPLECVLLVEVRVALASVILLLLLQESESRI